MCLLQTSLLDSKVLPRTASRICIAMHICAQVLKLQKSSFAPGVFTVFEWSTPFFLF